MGTDYYSGESLVVDIETIVKIIDDKNREAVIKAIREWCSEDDGEIENKFFKDLTDDITTAALQEKLIAHCEIGGEAGKYEGNCYLTHTDDEGMDQLWNAINGVSGTDFPCIMEVRVFDSYRQHADCPIGVASFLISRDDVYESQLSESGEFLQELCGGHINEISWTDVSY